MGVKFNELREQKNKIDCSKSAQMDPTTGHFIGSHQRWPLYQYNECSLNVICVAHLAKQFEHCFTIEFYSKIRPHLLGVFQQMTFPIFSFGNPIVSLNCY